MSRYLCVVSLLLTACGAASDGGVGQQVDAAIGADASSADATEAAARPANEPANHSSDQPLTVTRWTWWKMIPVPTNDGNIAAGRMR